MAKFLAKLVARLGWRGGWFPVTLLVPTYLLSAIGAAVGIHKIDWFEGVGFSANQIAGVGVGIVLGSLGVLAIWAVFGTSMWFWRQLAASGMAILLSGIVLLEFSFSDDSQWELLPAVPLVFLGAQVPFWCLWTPTGLRLQRDDSTTIANSGRFSIRQVFTATAYEAIATGLARFSVSGNDLESTAILAGICVEVLVVRYLVLVYRVTEG